MHKEKQLCEPLLFLIIPVTFAKLVTRECVPERDMLINLVPQLLNNKLLIVLIVENAKCKGGLGNVH